jgi:hypothetical protein
MSSKAPSPSSARETPPREIAAGGAEYLAPNVVHRGMNKTDKPVRLFVVRVKPQDKPLVEEVPPPQ